MTTATRRAMEVRDFFDRKTFDPVNNIEHQKTLNILRGYGSSRAVPSTACEWAFATDIRSGVFLDLGCGDSHDWHFAKTRGFDAKRIDLCPLFQKNVYPHVPYPSPEDFIQADVVEHIPFPDGSVAVVISQAMLDLIEPVAREQFFDNVKVVLAPGGIFACYIQWLQSGWGFDLNEEYERACRVFGEPNIHRKPQGFVVTKG